MPDVIPQLRGLWVLCASPLAGGVWCWMGHWWKGKFSHLSMLHKRDDNNSFTFLWGLLPSASCKAVGVHQFLKETWPCNAASRCGGGFKGWLKEWLLRPADVSVVWRLICRANTGLDVSQGSGISPAPSTAVLSDGVKHLLCSAWTDDFPNDIDWPSRAHFL